MLPTIQQDVWFKSTPDDWTKALALLDRLPSRATSSAAFDQLVYFIALDGTTRHGLSEAVKFILRGALGHAFYPSPPELRMQCDKAMEWHHKEADRIRRQSDFQHFRKEQAEWKPATEDEKARSMRVYAEFCRGYEKAATKDTFKLDPELVAKIPDNPKATIHQRKGVGQ